MGVPQYEYPALAAGVVLLAVGAWIFWMVPASRVHRAFGLLFALRGASSCLFVFYDSPLDLFGRVDVYVRLAIPFAAVELALALWAYRRGAASGSPWRSAWSPWALFFGALVVEAAYAVDHDLYLSPQGRMGALWLIDAFTYVAYAIVAAVLGYGQMVAEPGLSRRALFVLGLAFLVQAAYSSTEEFLALVGSWNVLTPILRTQAGFAIGALAIVLFLPVLQRWRGGRPMAGSAVRYGLAVAAAMATALATDAAFSRGDPDVISFARSSITALWKLGMAFIAAFAILRYRFLDLDVRVRWTISRGVVASAFVATFFVVTEALAYFLGRETENAYVGIVVTGVLVFALSPLKRIGDRVAKVAMPDALPVEERSLDERIALFAEQTRIAWEDGVLTAKERRMLDWARERLGVSEGQAARIERRVLEELYPVRRKRRARPASTAAPDRWAVRE